MGIGEWSRGRIIGRGSSATVSLASTSTSGDIFAVKSVELSRSAPLQREQSILSSLNCQYIVPYLGFDITQEARSGQLYYNLFMEYAAGGSLSDYVKKNGRLDESTIRCWTNEVASGIAYLHSCRLVHCDIKGENILIGADGRAKIADLGCARWLDEDCETRMRGTPMFMAPEVARGEEQGLAADIWALGCTVIEMATGGAPWPELSEPIAALHMIGFSSEVPELPSWMSDEAKDFLNKCLTRNPEERWTVEQLLSHPFVATGTALEQTLIKPNLNLDHTTPKSILDQDLWEVLSEQEDDENEEDRSVENTIVQRLAQLASGEPSWTWDESWETVRSDNSECSVLSRTVLEEVETETQDFITLMSPATVLGTSETSEDVGDFITESDENIWSNEVGELGEGNERGKGLSGYKGGNVCSVNKNDSSERHENCILFDNYSLLCFLLALCFCHFNISGSSRWHIHLHDEKITLLINLFRSVQTLHRVVCRLVQDTTYFDHHLVLFNHSLTYSTGQPGL